MTATTTTAPAIDPVEKAAAEAAESAIETTAFQAAQKSKKSPAKSKASKKSNPSTSKTKGKKTMATATAKKPAAKKAPADNGGLRTPQVRILRALAKAGKALSRPQISEKAPVDQAACVEYLGSHDDATRKANDKKHFPSLVTLGLVKHEKHDVDGRDTVVYSITAAGRAKLAKING